MPKERKQKVLRAIFGSKVPIDILKFSIDQGVSKKIYQKDLIKKLDYSNKTIIDHLKNMTSLRILEESMEKIESDDRAVWLKYYVLSDLGRWFALLLIEEESLPNEEKIEIVCDALRSYTRWIRKLSESLGMKRETLQEIFNEEIK
ncbi:MAG: hypothetical protein ACE5NN_06720 [Candidatus Bathyarchaeia archaeon]